MRRADAVLVAIPVIVVVGLFAERATAAAATTESVAMNALSAIPLFAVALLVALGLILYEVVTANAVEN